jgi:hypothetical protein
VILNSVDFGGEIMFKSFRLQANFCAIALFAPVLSGCMSLLSPSFREPDRLYTIDEQITQTRAALQNVIAENPSPTTAQRNNIITAYMFAIDLEYTKYEAQLTHEAEAEGFGSAAIVQVLSTTGALVAAPTTHILSAVTSGVNGIDSAYNQKILLSNAIQNLQTQMRTDRSEQAGYIYANMKCAASAYPLGMAMSDLELYYRAGTVPSALIGLSKTVNKADTDAKATKQANAPAAPAAAKAQLTASASVTQAKAQTATPCKIQTPTG